MDNLAYLLESGVKVVLFYGDRDYACNWMGGEAISLAIDYKFTPQFHAAGYEPLRTNSSYIGGLVRQYGNLSYSRVFQAGHMVPSWQPETSLEVFNRALGNRDIATGTKDTASGGYSSTGPSDTLEVKSEIPEPELMFCYTLLPDTTCTEAQQAAVRNGSAKIVRYIVEDANSTRLFPDLFGQDIGHEVGSETETGEDDGTLSVVASFGGAAVELVLD